MSIRAPDSDESWNPDEYTDTTDTETDLESGEENFAFESESDTDTEEINSVFDLTVEDQEQLMDRVEDAIFSFGFRRPQAIRTNDEIAIWEENKLEVLLQYIHDYYCIQ